MLLHFGKIMLNYILCQSLMTICLLRFDEGANNSDLYNIQKYYQIVTQLWQRAKN